MEFRKLVKIVFNKLAKNAQLKKGGAYNFEHNQNAKIIIVTLITIFMPPPQT